MIKIRNSENSYGVVTIVLHWLMAIIIIGLFVLGKYMMSLDYYDPFYHTGPVWHKSLGLLIAFLLIFRLFWKFSNPKVSSVKTHKNYEIVLALIIKNLLYLLIFICCMSGLLISMAEGAGVAFFNIFDVPAIISYGSKQADIAGDVHEISTFLLILLSSMHMIAALKHHFIDKDNTLKRMFYSN